MQASCWRWLLALVLTSFCWKGAAAEATRGKIFKVLPHLLDVQGRNARYPSLYERDAYQFYLRHHPEEVSTLRYDVEWKAHLPKPGELKLRMELRGSQKHTLEPLVVEMAVKPGWFRRWSAIKLTREQYADLGAVVAWRASLWQGKNLLAEQRSFLWQ